VSEGSPISGSFGFTIVDIPGALGAFSLTMGAQTYNSSFAFFQVTTEDVTSPAFEMEATIQSQPFFIGFAQPSIGSPSTAAAHSLAPALS
jgi:hypothetical protein